jgi:H+/Cl- antiporter ClcA
LFLNTEGAVIRALMNDKIQNTVQGYGVFTIIWYVLMITTAGVWTPAGLFLPGMLVGAGLGVMTRQVLGNIEK